MKFLIFIAPRDFKDETISMLKLLLDKYDVEYLISSYSTKNCIGSHGAVYEPQINTNIVDVSKFDGIIIADGIGLELYKIYEFRPFLDLLLKFNNANKYIITIDNAVKILAKANIIKNKKISVIENNDELKNFILLFHGIISNNDLEIANNLITIKDSDNIEEPLLHIFEHFGLR